MKIIGDDPSIGLVVGTCGSVPYVHLQLEARRRLYPEIPLLINDDCSEEQVALNDLCCEYDADYSFSSTRLGHQFGDTNAFWNGLLWAKRRKLDLLTKLSRRFIPLNDWRPSLRAVAKATQAATYSSICRTWHFGFRTESMAMHVRTWLSQHQIGDFRDRTARGDMLHGLPEAFFHAWSGNVHPPCDETITDGLSFGLWEWLGFARGAKSTNFLWHTANSVDEYSYLAKTWGLSYKPEDFVLDSMPSVPVQTHADSGPSIAVIIPTIGRATLERQLNQLRPQLRNDEIIVVGDGEQPNARAIVDAQNDSRIRYYEHVDSESAFGNAQRNFGVEQSVSDVLWFCDDDDLAMLFALAAIRENVKTKPVLFRIFVPGSHIWHSQTIAHANVSGAMVAMPRDKFRPWPVPSENGPISDLHWIQSLGDVEWNDASIYCAFSRGFGK